jgi:hypothetical protein
MEDPSKNEAERLLRPFLQSGEVLSAEPLSGSSPTLLVRVTKQDDALEKRVRGALRGIGWRATLRQWSLVYLHSS